MSEWSPEYREFKYQVVVHGEMDSSSVQEVVQLLAQVMNSYSLRMSRRDHESVVAWFKAAYGAED